MTTQLTFWTVNNLYHSPISSYNEQAQEAFASKSMMRLLVPDALVGHIVDQLDAMVERGNDPDYDFTADDFDGTEVNLDNELILTVKQAVIFLRFLERDIHIADATDAQKRNFVSAYERIMKQTLVVMPDNTDPIPDGDDTPDSFNTESEITMTTYRNPEIETKYKATLDKIIALFEITEHGLIVLRSALPNNAPIKKLQEAGYIRLVYINHIAPDYGLLAYWQATDPDGFNVAYAAIKEVGDVRGILRITRERMATIAPDVVEVEICHCAKCGDALESNWSLAVCDDCLWADAADDTPDTDSDVATEPAEATPAPSDNPPDADETAPEDLETLMQSWAWDIETMFNENTRIHVMFLGELAFDELTKWARVRKVKTNPYATSTYAYFRLEAWRALAKDNPAVYHVALRNLVLKMVNLRQVPHGGPDTPHAQKQRRAYRRLDRVYRTVSRYKYGVE